MSADECPHGMGDPAWCSICRHGPVRAEPVSIIATFSARYEGECRGCGVGIGVGQVVHRLSDGTYAHEGCQP